MVHLKINIAEGNNPFVLHLEMPSETRIIHLKARIETLYPEYPAPRQIIAFENRIISPYDFLSLEDLDIDDDNSNLKLSLLPPDNIQLKIVGIIESDFIVQGDLKVGTFKKQVAKRWGFPDHEMRWSHENVERGIEEEMDDNAELYHYHLDKDSVINAQFSA
ncbi:hypothetical protein M5689_015792 [Euphorbia peplus]|nr:hypothetical protein M5689_015792 [Euphorbia peplus]